MNLWEKVPKEIYNKHPGLRSSDLKLLLKSGLHFKDATTSRETKEQTDAQRFGEIIHGCILEPEEFLPKLVVSPGFDKRTTVGKQAFLDFQHELPVGAVVIKKDEHSKIVSITESIKNHPTCQKIFEQGCAEVSGFAVDELGIERKIQPDWRRDDGIIIDLKSTRDASYRSFRKDIVDYNYAIQAAYYLETANLIEPEKYHTWLWIAVENEAPHAIGIYQLDSESLKWAKSVINQALNKYVNCTKTNIWEGYDIFIQSISLPAYKMEI